MALNAIVIGRSLWQAALFCVVIASCPGCAQGDRDSAPVQRPPRVVVVAPVLNLSGSQDFDPLKVTDLIASEFLSFEGVAVVPVNLTLAELKRRGLETVETSEDATELARALGAEATIVTAITEYNPYNPPVVGLVMQWYSVRDERDERAFDPVAASRAAGGLPLQLSDEQPAGPRWQVQCVFNAAEQSVRDQVRAYAARREGHQSPYGWRKYLRVQELYVRYCSSAMIRAILMLDQRNRAAVEPTEAT